MNGIRIDSEKQTSSSASSVDNQLNEKVIAIDQSYFDEKINSLYDESFDTLVSSEIHRHRFDDYSLNPRTILKENERFCEDEEMNDLLLQETRENQTLYERLKQEHQLKNSKSNSSGSFSLRGLFYKSNLDGDFKKQAKRQHIQRYEINTNKVRDLSIQIQVASKIAEKARSEFQSSIANYLKKNGIPLDNASDANFLNKLFFDKSKQSDEVNSLIINFKNQYAAERLLKTKLEVALTAEESGLLNVSNHHKVEELRDSVKLADIKKMSHNLALSTALLEPTQVDRFELSNRKPITPTEAAIRSSNNSKANEVKPTDDENYDFSKFIESISSKFNDMFRSLDPTTKTKSVANQASEPTTSIKIH